MSPGVEIKLELNEGDELAARNWDLTATAYLHRADGTPMDAAGLTGKPAEADWFRLAPGRKVNVGFTFSELQVKVAGTFYLQIVVQDFNNETGWVVVATVDTKTFVVYDN